MLICVRVCVWHWIDHNINTVIVTIKYFFLYEFFIRDHCIFKRIGHHVITSK